MLAESIDLLLVEDNDADALLLQNILKEHGPSIVTIEGINVSRVSSIKEAEELLTTKKIDVLLLDMFLPDSQFLEGLKVLTAKFHNIPIIVYTVLYDSDTASEAFRLGAEDYIIKQFTNPTELLRSILAAIQRHKAKQEILTKLKAMLKEC